MNNFSYQKTFEDVEDDHTIISREYAYYDPNELIGNSRQSYSFKITGNEIITYPSSSYLSFIGTVTNVDDKKKIDRQTVSLVPNFMAHLIREINYKINNETVDKNDSPGIVSTLKTLAVYPKEKIDQLITCGFSLNDAEMTNFLDSNGNFNVEMNLELLLGFFEHYKGYVYRLPQELNIIIKDDISDALLCKDDCKYTIKFSKIQWCIRHIKLSDEYSLKFKKSITQNPELKLAFRTYEHRSILLKSGTTSESCNIATKSTTPSYVIVGFQTNKANNLKENASNFDNCSLKNIQLKLNGEKFPDKSWDLNFESNIYMKAYRSLNDFKYLFWDEINTNLSPSLTLDKYKKSYSIFVIDCNDSNKVVNSNVVDVGILLDFRKNIPDNTLAHIIIVYDKLISYNVNDHRVKEIFIK